MKSLKPSRLKGHEIQLTDAIDRLAQDEPVYAYEFEGNRYDVGDRKGFLQAQVEFALNRDDTRQAMEEIIENLGYVKDPEFKKEKDELRRAETGSDQQE